MRHKSPSELNSKTIRISLGDYALLEGISRQAKISFAEALHLLITEQAKQRVTMVPKAQIPMPTFSIKPVGTFRIRAQPTRAVNGHKVGVLVIKPRGGVINE